MTGLQFSLLPTCLILAFFCFFNPCAVQAVPLPDNHYATELSFTQDAQDDYTGTPEEKFITGYAMLKGAKASCSTCHYIDSSPIPKQWAASAHATMESSSAWSHYNWAHVKRGDCQRCHTTSGFISMAEDPKTYFTNEPRLQDNDGRWKPEILQCCACHVDELGTLRHVSKITDLIDAMAQKDNSGYNKYLLSTTEKRFDRVPDVIGVNLCLPCHSGSRTAQGIHNWKNDHKGQVYEGGFADKFSPHFLAAGAVLYQTSPYEFAGVSYSRGTVHANIGMISDAGPCVTCHMPEGNHTLKAMSGEHTACVKCHGQHMANKLKGLAVGFNDALNALKAELASNGFIYTTKAPYFMPDSWGSSDTYDKNLGVVFNYILLRNEPGAFVHNPEYTKKLVFDALDWLQNGSLTGTIQLQHYPNAAKWLGANEDSIVLRP
jgi:hypothetical protein